jgi:hypothetical protein
MTHPQNLIKIHQNKYLAIVNEIIAHIDKFNQSLSMMGQKRMNQ